MTSLFGTRAVHVFDLREVREVFVETKSGVDMEIARLVLRTKDAEVPFTTSFLSDDLEKKRAAVQAFLESLVIVR